MVTNPMYCYIQQEEGLQLQHLISYQLTDNISYQADRHMDVPNQPLIKPFHLNVQQISQYVDSPR